MFVGYSQTNRELDKTKQVISQTGLLAWMRKMMCYCHTGGLGKNRLPHSATFQTVLAVLQGDPAAA